jgi:uncharacterized membrane protein (TIGR02234 family)
VSEGARRELGAAVLACLVGAVLVLLALVRDWVAVPIGGSALLPDRVVGVSGAELAPGVRALALVGLAGVVGLAATRGRGRSAVGAVLGLVGVVVVVETVRVSTDLRARVGDVEAIGDLGGAGVVDGTLWPVVAVLGALLLVAAGALVTVRGRHWSALSERYDAPVIGARGGREPVPADSPADSPTDSPTDKAPVAPTDKALWDDLDRGEDPTTG